MLGFSGVLGVLAVFEGTVFEIALSAWLVASAILLIGTVVQACVGFGGNLLAVPVVVIVEPDLVPGAMLIPAFVLSAMVLAREYEHTDWANAGIGVVGRIPGSILGALLLVSVSSDALSVVFGVLILVAVILTASNAMVDRSVGSLLVAGVASGFMATAVAVGGPPIALLYTDSDGPTVRTTLSAFLAAGTLVSILVLAIAGQFGVGDLALGATLLPATLAGVALAGPMRSRIDDGSGTRLAVLALSAAAAIIAVVRGLT